MASFEYIIFQYFGAGPSHAFEVNHLYTPGRWEYNKIASIMCNWKWNALFNVYDLNSKCVWKSMHNYEAVARKVIFICEQVAAWLSLRQAPIYSTNINFTVIRDSLIHPKQNYKIKIIAMDIFITEWFAVIHCFGFGGISVCALDFMCVW